MGPQRASRATLGFDVPTPARQPPYRPARALPGSAASTAWPASPRPCARPAGRLPAPPRLARIAAHTFSPRAKTSTNSSASDPDRHPGSKPASACVSASMSAPAASAIFCMIRSYVRGVTPKDRQGRLAGDNPPVPRLDRAVVATKLIDLFIYKSLWETGPESEAQFPRQVVEGKRGD